MKPATFNLQLATPLSAWLAHGENDEIFPVSDARKVAEALRAAGAEVRLDVFPGRGHNFGEDQPLLVRQAAEFCTEALGGAILAPVKARSAGWIYWLPVALLGVVVWRCRAACTAGVPPDAAPGFGTSPLRAPSGRGLWRFAFAMALAAGLVSAAHLVLPLLPVNPTTLKLARQWNVRPELRADFDWLVSQPGAAGCRLRDLLDHLTLASLQRGQFGASLPEPEWREFVLSPWIEGQGGELGWRRELWEWLAPRVRRETDAPAAAQVIVRELRRRVLVEPTQGEANLHAAWTSGVVNPVQRERLLVGMLRSVGIPARLSITGGCELWSNGQWFPAPQSFPPSRGPDSKPG